MSLNIQYCATFHKAVRPYPSFLAFFLINQLFLLVLQLPYFFLRFCNLLIDVSHAFPSFLR